MPKTKKLFPLLIGIVLVFMSIYFFWQKPRSQNLTMDGFVVINVIDGDTFEINRFGRVETVRAIGMDTPETVDPRKTVQCFGVEASNRANQLLMGKKVRLEFDSLVGERDKYNRLLAYVWLEQDLFNKQMITEGYAHEYTYYSQAYKYQQEFKNAETFAQENERGLWNHTTCNGSA